MSKHWIVSIVSVMGSVVFVMAQQGPQTPSLGAPTSPERTNDWVLVERLIGIRKDYQRTLEQLRFYYLQIGDQERAKNAEEELITWHRIHKHAFIEALELPPSLLRGTMNIVDANNLLTRALQVKGAGYGTTYIDNQRRAEILLQELLTKYPQSDKIAVAAYHLGDIYESSANQMYRRAAWYYTRCYQWNSANPMDARLRAARIYEVKLHDIPKALEIYREITTSDHEPAHRAIAEKKIAELSGKR